MSRKAFFTAHCTHRFDPLHWGRLSEKSNIPQCESRIRFWPCIRGTEYFSLARTFRTVWGGEPAGTSLIGAAESERYSSMSERDAPSEREAPSKRETLSERETPSEREIPSERDADAADYEAGHSDAEFNEAAYPLSAGLHADCSCLK